jgi:protein gp37
MAENTKIEWAHHTFNPWMGCTKVSPACDHCYAETWSRRMGKGNLWQGDRQRTTPLNWRQPLKWNAACANAGIRQRVFCASLADVFDNQVPAEWRDDLWTLIRRTSNLDWLLLTKRPQNIAKMLPPEWPMNGWPNVWLGTTVENQEEANRRIPPLLAIPARIHFLSCEPLLGPVDLEHIDVTPPGARLATIIPCLETVSRIDWVIVGGESGGKARPMHPQWARNLRDDCAAAGVPFHFKQWGEFRPVGWHEGRKAGDVEVPLIYRVDDTQLMRRVGKRTAGRLLDDVEHNGVPA